MASACSIQSYTSPFCRQHLEQNHLCKLYTSVAISQLCSQHCKFKACIGYSQAVSCHSKWQLYVPLKISWFQEQTQLLPFKKTTPKTFIHQIFTWETFVAKILVFLYINAHTFGEFSRFLQNLSNNVSPWCLVLSLSYTEEGEKVKTKKKLKKTPQLRAIKSISQRPSYSLDLLKLRAVEVHSFKRRETSPHGEATRAGSRWWAAAPGSRGPRHRRCSASPGRASGSGWTDARYWRRCAGFPSCDRDFGTDLL